nr:unnamed protein product [Spirometra erinaceieuropaei]
MDLFAPGCANFGLTINMGKTVVMRHLLPSAADSAPCIHVNGNELKTMDTFAYLTRTLSHCVKINDEVTHQTSKASQAFGRA